METLLMHIIFIVCIMVISFGWGIRYESEKEEAKLQEEASRRKRNVKKKPEDEKNLPARYERRKFDVGDVVLYDRRGQKFDRHGNIDMKMEPYTRTGIMLISSFDFDSDNAMRCSVGRSAIGKHGVIYGDYAPGIMYNIRKAEKHHIRKFIRDIERSGKGKVYAKEIEQMKNML